MPVKIVYQKQYPINKDSREPSGAQETTLELTYT